MAVGYTGRRDRRPAIAESWNGTRWKLTAPPPLRAPLWNDCLSPSFCLAEGLATTPGSAATAAWNGMSWKLRHGLPPATVGPLSCVTPKFCIDIGVAGLTQLWNGRSWHSLATPQPAGSTDFDLSGVSCTSTTFCLAVGAYTTDPDALLPQTVAEIWNGSAWHLIASPTHTLTSSFSDVSCITPQHCVAVGAFFSHQRPIYTASNIAALWNGTAWHVTRLPGPVGFPTGLDHLIQGPGSISCGTASSCMAVGSFVNGRTRLPDSVAIVWNGTRWRLTKLAGPRSGIADVSCPRANECVAVGRAGSGTLAERWNGASWTLLKTPSV